MTNMDNIIFLISRESISKLEKGKYKLISFTLTKPILRDISSKLLNVKKDNDKYIFNYNGKEYEFKLLSDLDIKDADKRVLQSRKRYIRFIYRIPNMMYLFNYKNMQVNLIKTGINGFDLVIQYVDNNEEYIISYDYNLVMKKKDFYELFNVEEISTLSKPDIYFIFKILEKINDLSLIFYLMWFKEETFKDLSRNPEFSYLKEKYDDVGINKNNYSILGDGADLVFSLEEDQVRHSKYSYVEQLNNFTLNPLKNSKCIKIIDKERGLYQFDNGKINFKFQLLSDCINDEEVVNELLSTNRFHKCHSMSVVMAAIVDQEENTSAKVVAGTNKYNDFDDYFHSWVEIKDKYVLDYTHNIIMDKDTYYKIMGTKKISETPIKEYLKNLELLKQIGFKSSSLNNYFGSEVTRDLQKNKHLFK